LIVRPTEFDVSVAPLDVAHLGETLSESVYRASGIISGTGTQEPDRWHGWLLRTPSNWPRSYRASENGDEIASPHVPPENTGSKA